jgi:hypothetical protein
MAHPRQIMIDRSYEDRIDDVEVYPTTVSTYLFRVDLHAMRCRSCCDLRPRRSAPLLLLPLDTDAPHGRAQPALRRCVNTRVRTVREIVR